MRAWLLLLPFAALVACGGGEDEDTKEGKEKVVLKTEKDKLSYTLGAKQASDILNSRDPNIDKFDKASLVQGFEEGFKPGVVRDQSNPCMMTIQNMYGGAQGAAFDMTYVKEGCRCIGNITAGVVYEELDKLGQINRVDKKLLSRGFEDALFKNVDSVLNQGQREAIMATFNQEMQSIVVAKAETRWGQIRAIPGIQELENGIFLETIKAGTGPTPKAGQDIEASYILSDFDGNIIQNSKDVTPEGKFAAHLEEGPEGVIKGWVIGFQSIKKGGTYRLYIPSAMAYGEMPLQFEVELFNIGPRGSLKK